MTTSITSPNTVREGTLWASIYQAHWCLADRYEKRHKNLAAHVSPAFRVDLGDIVTVGQSRTAGGFPDFDHEMLCSQVNVDHYRKRCDSTCYGCQRARRRPRHLASFRCFGMARYVAYRMCCALDHDVYSKRCRANDMWIAEKFGYECASQIRDK